MESILEAFANDNLEVLPSTCPKSKTSAHLLSKADKLMEALEAMLNDKGKELLENLDSTNAKLDDISSTDRFIRGYRLGVLMMIDVFGGYDSLILRSKGGKKDE